MYGSKCCVSWTLEGSSGYICVLQVAIVQFGQVKLVLIVYIIVSVKKYVSFIGVTNFRVNNFRNFTPDKNIVTTKLNNRHIVFFFFFFSFRWYWRQK